MILNPEQLRAVQAISYPLLVLAGAGSGKTRVITEKIAYLIKHHYKAREIVAVTFTNKAAMEMKARIAKAISPARRRGLLVSTFHTLGLRMISMHLKDLGLRAQFSIYDLADSLKLLEHWVPPAKAQEKPFLLSVYTYISRWKNALLTTVEVEKLLPTDIAFEIAQQLYEPYQETLLSFNAVDFDDLITLPVKLLRTNSAISELWHHKIRYLLVDEYQDANFAQYELLKHLAPLGTFTVVGDDDQSIYAWRGARPENLVQLQNDYPTLQVIKLEQNYRSTGHILATANALIAKNTHVFQKTLWSECGLGERVRIICCQNEQSEAEQVVSDMIVQKMRQGVSWDQFAILYRGNYQSRLFETVLREHGIAYQLYGGGSWFSLSEVRDWFSFYRLLCNIKDDNAFIRAVTAIGKGVGVKTLEKLSHYAKRRGESLYMCADHLALQTILNDKSRKALMVFKHWVGMCQKRLENHSVAEVLREILIDSGYEDALYGLNLTSQKIKKILENIEALILWIVRVKERAPSLTFSEVLNRLILVDRLNDSAEHQEDAVQLMTLHASKGLQFPYVYLTGMEELLLPHHQSQLPQEIEEERRLVYVGITRAETYLTLTYAKRRKREGEVQTTEVSRFLEELPEKHIEWIGRTDKISEEDLKKRANFHLKTLKSMVEY